MEHRSLHQPVIVLLGLKRECAILENYMVAAIWCVGVMESVRKQFLTFIVVSEYYDQKVDFLACSHPVFVESQANLYAAIAGICLRQGWSIDCFLSKKTNKQFFMQKNMFFMFFIVFYYFLA